MINLLKKTSSRAQINIKEVKDGILILPNKQYRVILETSAVNFELKSDEEQDQILDTFQNSLNSLPCPIQILIRTREIDIEGYVEDVKEKGIIEKEAVYKEQMEEYTQFIKKLVSGNKILTRKFYIILSNTHIDSKDFSILKGQLLLHADIVSKSLEKLGMKTRQLGNLEILDLFYSFYNPSHIKSQPLSQKTLEAFQTQTYGY